jgi:hypothetical protein
MLCYYYALVTSGGLPPPWLYAAIEMIDPAFIFEPWLGDCTEVIEFILPFTMPTGKLLATLYGSSRKVGY